MKKLKVAKPRLKITVDCICRTNSSVTIFVHGIRNCFRDASCSALFHVARAIYKDFLVFQV